MGIPDAGNVSRRFPPWLGSAAVYALSIGCLIWVYHDFHWKKELPRLARIHWAWILLAVAIDILVYVLQAYRWNLLLAPVVRPPLWQSVQAIYIGLFANEVLPFRSGELIRCYLLAKWVHQRFTAILSSALIERLIDGVWLILGFYAVSQVFDIPDVLDYAALILTLLVAIVGALVLFAVFNKRFAHHVSTKHRWSEIVVTLIEGLHSMGRSKTFPAAVVASAFYLLLQVIPIHAMMLGYGLDLGLAAAAVVLVILRLSTVVPGLPGNLGLFNAAAFMALHNLLKIDSQTAKSLSAVMFFIITVPLLIAGSIALATTGIEIRELQRQARGERSAKPVPVSPASDN